MVSLLPPRDPSEYPRFTITEYDAQGNPYILAEYDDLGERWSCRFCVHLESDMFEMRKHLLKDHVNG